MSSVRFHLRGKGDVRKRLREAALRAARGFGAACYAIGNEIMTESGMLVPFDTGALHGSRYVTRPGRTRRGIGVEIGYGGPAKDYAVVQHEDETLNHLIGQSQYLRDPFEAARATAGEKMAAIVRAALERGGPALETRYPERPTGEEG